LTAQFPDIAAAAAAQLPHGCVVDGELVALDQHGRLSFDLLQRRLVTTPAKARRLVAEHPASFMAFDLLATAGVDIRQQRWSTRRSRLESLTGWVPPLQLTPVTFEVEEAREWYEVLPGAMGVEGLVIKARHGRYAPGRREWWKVNSGASDVVPGQRVARHGVVVRDGCRGWAVT
jgi:ATP-dependent DNA ligase